MSTKTTKIESETIEVNHAIPETALTKPWMHDKEGITELLKNANFTISKKGEKEWTVKRDGVEGYSHHTSKGAAFAQAERQIKEVKGREGRIKIHEDGGYTSNWLVRANKQAQLASGNQDSEIVELLKAQREKVEMLKRSKNNGPSTVAKEALALSKQNYKEIRKVNSEHARLVESNNAIDKDLQRMKTNVSETPKPGLPVVWQGMFWILAILVIGLIVVLSLLFTGFIPVKIAN